MHPLPVRPAVHFTARDTWLNDPNGLIHHDGVWHLYFQHNPEGADWGHMSWGHASSPDLVRWTEHPVALRYLPGEEVFSGSVVCDREDTAGFGAGALVAVYTSNFVPPHPRARTQAQSLASSTDGGLTFTRHPGNPVYDRRSENFRDPKVFRHDGHWVMVAVEAHDNAVVVARSDDLRSWTELSTFTAPDAHAPTWECPDLFPLVADDGARRWVLVVSVNPGGIAGGSGMRYWVGDFDGTRFVPDADGVHTLGQGWLDWGRDYYAAVSYADAPDGRRVMVGWLNNWDYAHTTPAAPWRGSMSVPRDLALVADAAGRYRVRQWPSPEVLADGVLPRVAASACVGGRDVALPALIEVDAGVPFTLRLGAATLEHTGSELRFQRRPLDFDPAYASTEVAPVAVDLPPGPTVVVLDHGSVEVFAAGGLVTLTDLVLDAPGATTVRVELVDG